MIKNTRSTHQSNPATPYFSEKLPKRQSAPARSVPFEQERRKPRSRRCAPGPRADGSARPRPLPGSGGTAAQRRALSSTSSGKHLPLGRHKPSTAAHGMLAAFPLASQAKIQQGSLLQFYSNQALSSDRGSAPIAEVSSRINFSPQYNEIHLKTFAAVTVFDLFNNSKKFPRSHDFNHSGIRSSLFSSKKKKPQLIKHKHLSHKSSSYM